MIGPIYSSVSRVPMAALNLWLPVFFHPSNQEHFNRTLPLDVARENFLSYTGSVVPDGTMMEAMHYYALESGYLTLNPASLDVLPPSDRHPYSLIFTFDQEGQKVMAFHMQTDDIIFPILKQQLQKTR